MQSGGRARRGSGRSGGRERVILEEVGVGVRGLRFGQKADTVHVRQVAGTKPLGIFPMTWAHVVWASNGLDHRSTQPRAAGYLASSRSEANVSLPQAVVWHSELQKRPAWKDVAPNRKTTPGERWQPLEHEPHWSGGSLSASGAVGDYGGRGPRPVREPS